MKLSELLHGIKVEQMIPELDITGISTDSDKVKNGHLFICIKGNRYDGHSFAETALENGAELVLCERMPDVHDSSRVMLTESTRKAASIAWYNYYLRPADEMTKIAITGTSGKTSVAFLLKELLSADGRRVGAVTTIRTTSMDRVIELGYNGGSSVTEVSGAMTTPDPEYLWYAVSEMKKDGCDTVIYEASSQAIVRETLSAVTPELCVFTNLSEEHMDAHGSMENYFAAKSRLLDGVKNAVVNIDDEYFSRLPDIFNDCRFVKVSTRREKIGKCDVCAIRYRSHGVNGTEYVYFSNNAVFNVKSSQIGSYSVYNTMESAAAAMFLGVSPDVVQNVIHNFNGADGRMHRVEIQNDNAPCVFIDYAHTPLALEAACNALCDIINTEKSDRKRRLITVFGCGGNRDRTKRPHMAQAVQKYSDMTVITNDNPRNESPEGIINDILCGIDKTKPYKVIRDRKAAIRFALEYASVDDIVLLAGKGHEKYEITSRGKIPFDEELAVREILDGSNGNYKRE